MILYGKAHLILLNMNSPLLINPRIICPDKLLNAHRRFRTSNFKYGHQPSLASVHSGCSWLDEHIKSFVKRYSPNVIFTKDLRCIVDSEAALYQICDGQRCNTNDFIVPSKSPKSSLINVYPNDDALTRKNCLSRIIEYWVAKRPESILKSHVPTTVQLDLDYAEYIEYSLAEADSFELCRSMEANGDKEPSGEIGGSSNLLWPIADMESEYSVR
jgi:hypothetical protein